MSKLTIEKARKILGKQAEDIPDEEIARDVQVAELLKNVFFNNLKNGKLKTLPHNNAKT